VAGFLSSAVHHVHDNGPKLGWAPWSGAYLATNWRTYRFDWAVTQPNLMFSDDEYFPAAKNNELVSIGPVFFSQDVASLAKFAQVCGPGRAIYDRVREYPLSP
jgi:hypothetical protein